METINPPIANATNKVMQEARLFLDRSSHHLIPFDNQGLDILGTLQAFVEAQKKAGRVDGCRHDQDEHRIVQRTADRISHHTLPEAPGLTPLHKAEGQAIGQTFTIDFQASFTAVWPIEIIGGPGRTRTSNQTVMSAPVRRRWKLNFYRFCGTFAFVLRASANEMTNDCAALWPLPIASAAPRMCKG